MTPEQVRDALPHADRSGINRIPSSSTESLKEAADTLGFACFQIHLGEARAQPAMLKLLGRALGFPSWYGANLDALYDCLTDFSWHEAPGYVLILAGAPHQFGKPFVRIEQVFNDAIDAWRERGIPFWIFLDSSVAEPLNPPNTA